VGIIRIIRMLHCSILLLCAGLAFLYALPSWCSFGCSHDKGDAVYRHIKYSHIPQQRKKGSQTRTTEDVNGCSTIATQRRTRSNSCCLERSTIYRHIHILRWPITSPCNISHFFIVHVIPRCYGLDCCLDPCKEVDSSRCNIFPFCLFFSRISDYIFCSHIPWTHSDVSCLYRL
jgi:hypothetical protein